MRAWLYPTHKRSVREVGTLRNRAICAQPATCNPLRGVRMLCTTSVTPPEITAEVECLTMLGSVGSCTQHGQRKLDLASIVERLIGASLRTALLFYRLATMAEKHNNAAVACFLKTFSSRPEEARLCGGCPFEPLHLLVRCALPNSYGVQCRQRDPCLPRDPQ